MLASTTLKNLAKAVAVSASVHSKARISAFVPASHARLLSPQQRRSYARRAAPASPAPEAPEEAEAPKTYTTEFIFAFLSGAGAILGYNLAQRLDEWSSEPSQYGTPAEFKKAIKELQGVFPDDDMVLTDPEELQAHGMTLYGYHQGQLACFWTSCFQLTGIYNSQTLLIVWWCAPGLPKMS
jgi:hypothetical protein